MSENKIADEELEQWATFRADDAGRLARELIAARRGTDNLLRGIELAARFLEKRRDKYVEENGGYDPDTGITKLSRDGEGYVAELDDLIEGIRALSSTEGTEG